MAELKLRRLTELNQRLQEDLNRRRIPVSEAAMDLIAFTDKEPKVSAYVVQLALQ